MTNFRKVAKGRPCMYRAPGCDGGGETTVLAHVRRAGISGIGLKSFDLCGFWSCANCHDIYDRRKRLSRGYGDNAGHHELELWAFDAVLRTLDALHREKLI